MFLKKIKFKKKERIFFCQSCIKMFPIFFLNFPTSYETVAMITNEFSGSSDSDDDSDDAIEIFHEVHEAEELFTEYEVDSDADREEIKQREGDRDSSKESDEDSIIAVSFN